MRIRSIVAVALVAVAASVRAQVPPPKPEARQDCAGHYNRASHAASQLYWLVKGDERDAIYPVINAAGDAADMAILDAKAYPVLCATDRLAALDELTARFVARHDRLERSAYEHRFDGVLSVLDKAVAAAPPEK